MERSKCFLGALTPRPISCRVAAAIEVKLPQPLPSFLNPWNAGMLVRTVSPIRRGFATLCGMCVPLNYAWVDHHFRQLPRGMDLHLGQRCIKKKEKPFARCPRGQWSQTRKKSPSGG